jgi:hypothetical protein
LATPLITAFKPGQSPPPVNIPILLTASLFLGILSSIISSKNFANITNIISENKAM